MADITKAQTYVVAGMLIYCLGNSVFTFASEPLRMRVQNGGDQSGVLKDGDVITRGYLATQDSHAGFQIWSETAQQGSTPNRYTIFGTQHHGNVLHVRIEAGGRYLDTNDGGGVIIDTDSDAASFSIVSDGVQNVVADSYQLELKGAIVK